MEETPAIIPIKRRRRKKSVSLDSPHERAEIPVRPKRIRKRATNPNREIIKTMRRLGLATSGLGPSAPEIFKAATLQCVQQKLEQIAQMLQLIVPLSPALSQIIAPPIVQTWDESFNGPTPAAYAKPTHQFTPEEADARFLATKHAPKKEEVCQICGHDAVYVTKKNVPLCIIHRQQGIEDDRSDILAERMRLSGIGFGGQEEVIRVPQNVIDDALARDGGE